MLKSQEMKLEILDLANQIKSMGQEGASEKLYERLSEMKAAYEKQLIMETEGKKRKAGKQVNKKNMKNQIFKCMLRGDAFTEEMQNSGIELPKILNAVGAAGQAGAVADRGGYLVDSEFLDVDIYGGEVRDIPARDITVSLPTGKIPNFDLNQAKAAGVFMAPFDELSAVVEKHAIFGQLAYTCVDKAGIIPISNRLLEDASADVVGLVGQAFVTASRYQRNADLKAALTGVANMPAVYAGEGKTFSDVEAVDAIITAVRSKLTGVNRTNAKVVIGDTNFGKLAAAKDKNGNYYMRPMVSDPARFAIDGVEIIPVDDSIMSTGDQLDDFCYVGNFERLAFINRKGLEISSDVSAGFTRDALLVKAVKRSCVLVLEPGAFVKVAEGASA